MDFLTIGHACHDTSPPGFLPGGAVTYAGIFAHQLGLKTGVLTSVGSDYLFKNLFDGIQFEAVAAEQTTVFQNKYIDSERQQHLLARASDLIPDHLPDSWKNPKMVFISPIANEVDFKFLDTFKDALVMINPQGWMRRWNKAGRVFSKTLNNSDILSKADITVISEEDANHDQKIISAMAEALQMLVVTKGEKGCDVYVENNKTSFPAYPAQLKDATGAGDVFSAAFLIFYYKSQDWKAAARYANIAAAYCIEGQGVSNLPTEEMIRQRLLGFC